MQTRRGFLGKCLAGAAVALGAGPILRQPKRMGPVLKPGFTFGVVTLRTKKLAVMIRVPNEMLKFSCASSASFLDVMVPKELAKAFWTSEAGNVTI